MNVLEIPLFDVLADFTDVLPFIQGVLPFLIEMGQVLLLLTHDAFQLLPELR